MAFIVPKEQTVRGLPKIAHKVACAVPTATAFPKTQILGPADGHKQSSWVTITAGWQHWPIWPQTIRQESR